MKSDGNTTMNDEPTPERHVALARLLLQIRWALDDHNVSCPLPAAAVILHPDQSEILFAESIFGLPVETNPEAAPGTVRFGCDGSAWKIDEEIAASGILDEDG